jgi:hypothetical protein
MAHITVADAQAWAQPTKLDLDNVLDGDLEGQVSTQILARVATAYDTSSWLTTATTPALVKSIIAMYYIAWLYERLYSDDNTDENAYAVKLMQWAEDLLTNIISGVTPIGVVPANDQSSPAFYPTDVSSASEPTEDDPSLGPASFSMGQVF